MAKKVRRLAFDLETEPFSELFYAAPTDKARRRHAPKLRLACVYDESADAYHYYTNRDAQKLIKELVSADELISFNGKRFDMLVLQRHHGLGVSRRFPTMGKHVDICELMTAAAGHLVSLDRAAQCNLGERKHTSGRATSELSLDKLKIACRSDVSQTYRLWRLYAQNKLRLPPTLDDYWRGEAGSSANMPSKCSICGDGGSLVFVEADANDMTEGQFADYLAGAWGFSHCRTCNNRAFWQM